MSETHPAIPDANDLSDDAVLRNTQRWFERAVVGLNLCPFAKGAQSRDEIWWRVSAAQTEEQLREDLIHTLRHMMAQDAKQIDTTVLIVPHVLRDFLDYNDFLDEADYIVQELQLEGVVQIATFHPQYQFADTAADDISNATNRAPYPILHLLREASVDRAVDAFPDAETIYERNIETMKRLGDEGWQKLFRDSPVN